MGDNKYLGVEIEAGDGGGQNQDETPKRVVYAASGSNPDAEAEVQNISRQSGEPAPLVKADPAAAKYRAAVNSIDWSNIQPGSALHTRLSDHAFASVAHDDVNNLSLFGSARSAWHRGILNVAAMPVALKLGMDSSDVQMYNDIEGMKRKGGFDGGLTEIQLKYGVKGLEYAAKDDLARSSVRSAAEAEFAPKAEQAARHIEAINQVRALYPNNQAMKDFQNANGFVDSTAAVFRHPLDFAADFLPESLPSSFLGMVGGAVSSRLGGASIGLSSAGASYEQGIYDSLQKMGIDTNDREAVVEAFKNPVIMKGVLQDAATYSGSVGVVDYFTGKLAGKIKPYGTKYSDLATKEARVLTNVKQKLGNAAAEMGMQATGGAGGEFLGQTLTKDEYSWKDIVLEALGEVVTGTPTETGGIAMGEYLSRRDKAARAVALQAWLEETNKSAAATKLLTRAPSVFAETEQAMAELDGAPSTVYIDAADLVDTLHQSGQTLADFTKPLDDETASAVMTAVQNRGTVEIPIGKFRGISQTDVGKALQPHVRLEEDGMSVSQAEQFMAEYNDKQTAEADKILKGLTDDDPFRTSAKALESHFEQELTTQAVRPPDVAKYEAKLAAAPFIALAHRFNKAGASLTPEQFFQRIAQQRAPLNVRQGMTQQPGTLSAGGSDISTTDGALSQGNGSLQSGNAGVAYKHGQEILESRIEQWFASVYPDGRGRIGLVGIEWAEPSRYKAELGKANPFIPSSERIATAEEGRVEQDRLIAAAKEGGFFIGPDHPLVSVLAAQESRGGMEHDVYFVGEPQNRVVIRNTLPGGFGHANKYSPAKYLQRLAEYNQTFPEIQIRLIGVGQREDGSAVILTAQPFVQGKEYQNDNELDAAMRKHGWFALGVPSKDLPARYQHRDSGAILSDVHHGNVLHIGDELFPVDVIVEKLPKKGEYYQEPETPRATFNPRTMTITMLEAANLSSFIHEGGHGFLEILMMAARMPDAPQSVKEDASAFFKWAGIEDTPEMSAFDRWDSMSLEEKRPYHEQWAETFEQYTMTGKAPSIELAAAFRRFRDWMVSIYRTLKQFVKQNPNARLSPEVTAVFDRLLATDEQISEAEQTRSLVPLFDSKPELMTPDEWRNYQREQEAARSGAVEAIDLAKMRDMRWMRTRAGKVLKRLQKDVQDRRREMRREATRKVMGQPVYQALQFLTNKCAKVKAQKRAPRSKDVDTSIDSMLVAIRKMGGIDRESAVAEYGLDAADFSKGVLVGRTKDGQVKGMAPGEAEERLAELGYIPTDKDGKAVLHGLQDRMHREAVGDPQYSIEADWSQIMPDGLEGMLPPPLDFGPFDGGRLSRDWFTRKYGSDVWSAVWHGLEQLTAEPGIDPDLLAPVFGFGSGDELATALLGARPIQEEIDRVTDQMLLERYGDISSPEAMARALDEAMMSSARSRVIATELAALDKGVGPIRQVVAAAKMAAVRIIGRQTIRNVRPERYKFAAGRAAQDAVKALKAADTKAAVAAKRAEILNIELHKASAEVRSELNDALKMFGDIFKGNDDDVAKKRDLNAVYLARTILARYGLSSERQSKKAEDYLALMSQYSPQDAANLDSLLKMLPAEKDYRDLTVDEFKDLSNVVSGLWQQAKNMRTLELAGEKIAIEDLKRTLVDEAGGLEATRAMERTLNRVDRLADYMHSAKAAARRAESWCDFLGKNATKFIFRPVVDATTAHRHWRTKYLEKYRDLLASVEDGLTFDPIHSEALSFTFSGGKSEILHALLHSGNESNFRKLLIGRGWGVQDENGKLDATRWNAFLGELADKKIVTKRDMDFVQSVWDLMEEMKPDAQKAHYQMYGYYFSEITSEQVSTPWGVYRGGYVPAIADRTDPKVAKQVEADDLLHSGNASIWPTTGRGFTKGRVEINRPLELDLRALSTHIDKVSRFVNIEPVVQTVVRVINQPDVQQAFNTFSPDSVNGMLIPWLQRSAQQTVSTPGDIRFFNVIARYLRTVSGA